MSVQFPQLHLLLLLFKMCALDFVSMKRVRNVLPRARLIQADTFACPFGVRINRVPIILLCIKHLSIAATPRVVWMCACI